MEVAMAGPAAIVRELHRLWRHAKDLQAEIERGPRLLRAQQAKIAKQEDTIREVHEAVKRLKVAMHEKEVSLKARQQQIDKHQMQLNGASSKKEYDALKVEIASDKKACQQLEEEILELLAETEAKTAQIPAVEKAVQAAKAESARIVDDLQTRRNDLVARLSETHEKLKEVEASLSADVRPVYDRLLAGHGEDAMAMVQGRTCAACYTDITAQSYNELMQERFVVCKNCGRMLYLPAAETVTEGA